MPGFKFPSFLGWGAPAPARRNTPAPAPTAAPTRPPVTRQPEPEEDTPVLDSMMHSVNRAWTGLLTPWGDTPPGAEREAKIEGRDGHGIGGSYETESDGTKSEVSGGVDFADGEYGVEAGWKTSTDGTGTRGSVEAGYNADDGTVTVGGSHYTTERGNRNDGGSLTGTVGRDSFEVSGDHFQDGEGVGGRLGYDRDGNKLTTGVTLANENLNGGLTVVNGDHTSGIDANIGASRGGNKVGLSASYNVTTDEDFSEVMGADARGRYAMPRHVMGEDMVSFGLRDAESWSVGASASAKMASAKVKVGHSEGSSVQFMQTADSLGLSSEDLMDEKGTHEVAAEQMGERLLGVNGPQDLDWVDDGEVNSDVLARGTAWSFDNFSEDSAEIGLGLSGLGLSMGGADRESQELTIARTNSGDDKLVVDFTAADRDHSTAGVSAFDEVQLGLENNTTETRNVRFELDPADPDDMEALDKLTSTGMLPGAELGLERGDRQEYSELYSEFRGLKDSGGYVPKSTRERLAELSQTANGNFLNNDDFDLNGEFDYESRKETLEIEDRATLSALGFDILSASARERWWTEDYMEGDEQQRELGFDYDRGESRFLGMKTGESENSFLAMNPRSAVGLGMVGGSEWKLERDQAQEFIDLGLPGSEAWRMQSFADNDLDRFTGVAQASMAMDDKMLDDTMSYFGDRNMDDHWGEVSQLMAEDPSLRNWRGMDPGYGGSDEVQYDRISSLVRNVDFIDHSDPEARLKVDPMMLLAEEAKREAYRQNSDQIMDLAKGMEGNFADVDELMDAIAGGEMSSNDKFLLASGASYGGGTMFDGFVVNEFGDQMNQQVGEIIAVNSPETFAALDATAQEAWIATNAGLDDSGNGWNALDMVAGAVDVERAKTGESDPDGLRDRLTRRLFREIEQTTGDRSTATMEYISFIGELEGMGGEHAAIAGELKQGVHVEVVDEGVMKRAGEAADAIGRFDDGMQFDTGSDFSKDLNKEVEHLFDNDFGRDMKDADDLMDRMEGLAMASGGDPAALDTWLQHAAETVDFPGSGVEQFVSYMSQQMVDNDEYYTKLQEVLNQSSHAPNQCLMLTP